MIHKVAIHNRGQLIYEETDTDIGELTLSVCSVMLGIRATYMQVYVDEQYFDLPNQDIGVIRNKMMDIMKSNEERVNFGIDGLFEV